MGSGYVIEHCVAAFLQRQKREICEDYISDALYYIAGQVGIKLNKRLHEIRHPAPVDTDERTPQEIVKERVEKYGIAVVKN